VIVTAGALGDVFGRRRVFLGGLALFVASCALIALSTSAAGVVGGRMIQGLRSHRRGHDQRPDVRVEPVLPDPSALGLSAFQAGLATLPAAAAMIAITPAIAPIAAKLGGARAIVVGFGLAALGFGSLVFVDASWEYVAFLLPLIVLSIGLGIANGPASSGSTPAVPADQVGQASGISNMARYVGAAVAVAVVAMVNNAVAENHRMRSIAPPRPPSPPTPSPRSRRPARESRP
jgi:MFS family permease